MVGIIASVLSTVDPQTSRLTRRPPPGSLDDPDFPAPSSAAKEPIAAIRLPRKAYSLRQLEPFQDLAGSTVHSPHVALVAFPGAVRARPSTHVRPTCTKEKGTMTTTMTKHAIGTRDEWLAPRLDIVAARFAVFRGA